MSTRTLMTSGRRDVQNSGRVLDESFPVDLFRSLFFLTMVINTIFIITLQGCCSIENNCEYEKTVTETEIAALSNEIISRVKGLGYSNRVASDFVKMVGGWRDKQAGPVIAGYKQILEQARTEFLRGNLSKVELARIEGKIVNELGQLIREKISYNKNFFELGQIIKNRQAQCLGYSQLLYILGCSIGLDVTPINVLELRQARAALSTDSAHSCCMVKLADDKTIVVDLVEGGFISGSFYIADLYIDTGSYLSLEDNDSLLKLDKKIQILDRNGLLSQILNNRAVAHLKLAQYENCVNKLTAAISLFPNYVQAYNNRGVAYAKLGQIEKAIADYTKAVELHANQAESYYNRAVAYCRLSQFAQAVDDFTAAINLNPNHAQAYNNRGLAYSKLGQNDKAISEYNNSIRLNSNFAKAYGNRAISYVYSGRQTEAKRDLLKAVELEPALKTNVKKAIEYLELDLDIDSPALVATR